MRIAILTDTHLSERAPDFVRNTEAVLAWIADQAPDLTVHLGDITLDGANCRAELAFARDVFAGAAIRFLPGNHDIGETPVVAQRGAEHDFDPAALAAYRDAFGDDRWSFEAEDWQIIGLNAQLIGLGGEEEEAQRAWLEEQLARSRAKLGVMLHKPLFRNGPADTERHQRYLPVEPRLALARMWQERDLRFVMAGHTHQLRRLTVDDTEHIWAPSGAYIFPDRVQERIGSKQVGAMLLELAPGGHSAAFAIPPGVAQLDLTDFAHLVPALAERLRGGAAAS